MVNTNSQRLTSDERRASIIASATTEFARGGYGGARTAAIARDARINETLLFRHFGSKQGLYLACIDHVWSLVRQRCATSFAAEPDPAQHWRLPGRVFLELSRNEPELAGLWARALSDSTGISKIDEQLAGVMREIHAFAVDVITRSQLAGGVLDGRNPRAEAWLVIAIGLLATVGQRLGEVVLDDLDDVLAAHRTWLTGTPDP